MVLMVKSGGQEAKAGEEVGTGAFSLSKWEVHSGTANAWSVHMRMLVCIVVPMLK